ncbi:MAG: hypothetical protein ABI778_05645 [Ignavibacteriota bacterium]
MVTVRQKGIRLLSIISIGFLCFFFAIGEEKIYAQAFPVRNWWTPGSMVSLPVMDSLFHPNPLNEMYADYQHTLSLDSWSSKLRLSSNILFANDHIHPEFFITAEGRSRLREDTHIRTREANGLIEADYPFDSLRNGITVSFFGATYSLDAGEQQSLSQSGSITNLSDGYGVLGGKYFLMPKLELTAGAGIAHKSFEAGGSAGTIFRSGLHQDTTELSEDNIFDASASLDERHFSLSDERSRNDNIYAHLISNFGESGWNDASGNVAIKRRDFFFTKDATATLAKQERNETAFTLHDALQYPIIRHRLIANFLANISPREITRRTPSVDIASLPSSTLTSSTFLVPSTTSALDADFSGKLELYFGDYQNQERTATLSSEMRYSERTETSDVLHGETGLLLPLEVQKLSAALGQTSYAGQLTSLQISTDIPLASRDLLHADLISRIYRYDTPSEDNHDDRDELNIGMTIGYSHFFTESLEFRNELRLAKSHLVYLASDRTLQNYAGQTIAFSTDAAFRTELFSNRLHGEVFANYSVYDFAAPVTGLDGARDYLIRGVNGSDSIRIPLGKFALVKNTLAELAGLFDLRLYERGAYNAAAFTERPVLRTTEISAEATINIVDRSINSPTLLKIGAKTFLLRRFSPRASAISAELDLQQRVDRIGPLVVLIVDHFATKGPRLYGSLWYSFVTDESPEMNILNSSTQIEARLAAQWIF